MIEIFEGTASAAFGCFGCFGCFGRFGSSAASGGFWLLGQLRAALAARLLPGAFGCFGSSAALGCFRGLLAAWVAFGCLGNFWLLFVFGGKLQRAGLLVKRLFQKILP